MQIKKRNKHHKNKHKKEYKHEEMLSSFWKRVNSPAQHVIVCLRAFNAKSQETKRSRVVGAFDFSRASSANSLCFCCALPPHSYPQMLGL